MYRDPSHYIHRAGRTGRAGHGGTVITFFTRQDTRQMQFLEKSIGMFDVGYYYCCCCVFLLRPY